MIPSFHWAGTPSFQILLKRLYSMLTAVSMSALMASASISSGPAAFPPLRVMLAFLISAFEGLSQLMGSSVSVDRMSGDESGMERFSSSGKCSAHRFSCSLVVVSGFPFLSFTGLSDCWKGSGYYLITVIVAFYDLGQSSCILCLALLLFRCPRVSSAWKPHPLVSLPT